MHIHWLAYRRRAEQVNEPLIATPLDTPHQRGPLLSLQSNTSCCSARFLLLFITWPSQKEGRRKKKSFLHQDVVANKMESCMVLLTTYRLFLSIYWHKVSSSIMSRDEWILYGPTNSHRHSDRAILCRSFGRQNVCLHSVNRSGLRKKSEMEKRKNTTGFSSWPIKRLRTEKKKTFWFVQWTCTNLSPVI